MKNSKQAEPAITVIPSSSSLREKQAQTTADIVHLNELIAAEVGKRRLMAIRSDVSSFDASHAEEAALRRDLQRTEFVLDDVTKQLKAAEAAEKAVTKAETTSQIAAKCAEWRREAANADRLCRELYASRERFERIRREVAALGGESYVTRTTDTIFARALRCVGFMELFSVVRTLGRGVSATESVRAMHGEGEQVA